MLLKEATGVLLSGGFHRVLYCSAKNLVAQPVGISTFIAGDFGSCESDAFGQSNGRWMSLTPFLVMLLTEIVASPGWVSFLLVLSIVSGQDQVHIPTIVCKESKNVFFVCVIYYLC
jgi:hypothetical protein